MSRLADWLDRRRRGEDPERLSGWEREIASDDQLSPGLLELIRRIAETIELLRRRAVAEALGELLGHR